MPVHRDGCCGYAGAVVSKLPVVGSETQTGNAMRERRGHGLGRKTRVPFAVVILAIAQVLVAAPVLAVSPASAASAVSASNMVLTMFSAPGDFIGQGISREFNATNASISGTAASTGISLSVNGGTVDSSWSFLVDPPPGRSFREGYYSGVQRAEFRAAGHPGLDIAGSGRGCDADTGSFEVRDLALSGSKITRLDLLYTQYCDGGPGALFGEIRIGEPQPSGLLVSSNSITWPPTGAGGTTTVPLYIRNRGSRRVSVSGAALTGYAADDFRVRKDGCSGRILPPVPPAPCRWASRRPPPGRAPRRCRSGWERSWRRFNSIPRCRSGRQA